MSAPLTRRDALRLSAAGLGAGLLASCRAPGPAPRPKEPPVDTPPAARLPVAFVGHGAPTLALDPVKGGALTRWAAGWPALRAVLVLSAHWEAAPLRIGATRTLPLIYDFRGFPPPLYAVRYPAPGAPWLAQRLSGLLADRPHAQAPERGLDHGAWVPLRWLLPAADVPVLSLSLPSQDPAALFELGRRLAPLRDEGVLLLASGNVTHNLGQLSLRGDPPPPAWASDFDRWLTETVEAGAIDTLLQWAQRAPAPRLNHPTPEHLTPLLVAAGAAFGDGGRPAVRWPITGFEYGSLSRRSLQLG